MERTEIKQWSLALDDAEQSRTSLERITAKIPNLDLTSAYDIQDELLRLRCDRGEKIIGYKMGLTSKAKMEQMGVRDPIMGVLTDAMQVQSSEAFNVSTRIHPRIEPEIAFRTKAEMRGVVTREAVLANLHWIAPALEIIDSRYTNFDFRLPDVLADNCSSSAFVLGEPVREWKDIPIGDLPMEMKFAGVVRQRGASSAILGHPADSVVALVGMLHARGKTLPADSIVLAGAATAAVALEPGVDVCLSAPGFADVSIRVATLPS